ncbi:MAG: HAD-IA family hydrolase [Ferruginibacter sp.]|nr:HAD-IA family hydrolase [Ferruginibacter sp.]
MLNLKNIIFDLGAVLINIDYKKTEKAFKKLGYNNFDKMFSQFTANDIFQKLETGYITENDFYKEMIALNQNTVSAAQIKNAWNEILLDWRIESLNFLETLPTKYNLYLLSNTNIIHQKAFYKSLKVQTGRLSLQSLFLKEYYSHKIHLRKPNVNIFKFVVKDAKININETLFIDDSSNNIDAAKLLGFKTHLLLPNERIENLKYENF